MTNEDLQALHRRLERVDEKLDQIVAAVTKQVAICGPSRARLEAVCETVYGNGCDGLLARLARLETVRRAWAGAAAGLLGLLSGIMLTVLAWLLGR